MNTCSTVFATLLAVLLFEALIRRPAIRRCGVYVPLVTRLNVIGASIMLPTEKLFLSVAPTSAGVPVDFAKFPGALTEVTWSVEPPEAGSVNTTTPDLFNAEFTPAREGDVVVKVSAKNTEGTVLEESFSVNVAAAVPVVDALNLAAVVA